MAAWGHVLRTTYGQTLPRSGVVFVMDGGAGRLRAGSRPRARSWAPDPVFAQAQPHAGDRLALRWAVAA